MKFCIYCGAKNEDDASFCTSCGKKIATGSPEPTEQTAQQPQTVSQTEPQTEPQTDFAPTAPEATVKVKNDTPLTVDTLKKLYKTLKNCAIIMIVCGGIVLCGAFIDLLNVEKPDFVFFGAGVVFILCGLLYLYQYYGVYGKNKLLTDKTHTLYLCDDEGVTQIFYDGEREIGKQRIEYVQLLKVTRKKEYIVLHVGSGQGWHINRYQFTQGTEADFIALLKRGCAPNCIKIK